MDAGHFTYEDFEKLLNYDFDSFTKKTLFDAFKNQIENGEIKKVEDMKKIEIWSSELSVFCNQQGLTDPDENICTYKPNDENKETENAVKIPSIFPHN